MLLDFSLNAEQYPHPTARALHHDVADTLRASVQGWSDTDSLVSRTVMNEQHWQLLMYPTRYDGDHWALVLRLIDHCAGKTFPQDLIMYLWDQAKQ